MPKGREKGAGGTISEREIRSLTVGAFNPKYFDAEACGRDDSGFDNADEIPKGCFVVRNLESGSMILKIKDYPNTVDVVNAIHDLQGIKRCEQVLTFTESGPGGTSLLNQAKNEPVQGQSGL